VVSEITIYGTNGETLTSASFGFIVSTIIREDGVIESTNEFTALTDALMVVTTIANKLDKSEFTTFKDSTVTSLANNSTQLTKKQDRKAQVVLTFDDGYTECENAYNIMKANSLVGSFGLINGRLYNSDVLSISKFLQYEKEGFEVFSHSYNHLDWRSTSGLNPTPSEVFYEYGQSAIELRRLGFSCKYNIIPYSSVLGTLYPEILKYYDYLLVGGTGLNNESIKVSKRITRIVLVGTGLEGAKTLVQQAIDENKMLVFYDHRIGYAGSMTTADFTAFCVWLKTKVDSGEIEVNTVTNALKKYINQDATKYETCLEVDKNIFPKYTINDIDSTVSILRHTTNTVGGTADSLQVEQLQIPVTTVGKMVALETVIPLTVWKDMGESIYLSFSVMGSNTQAQFHDYCIEGELLDINDVILSSTVGEWKNLNLNKTFNEFILLANSGVDIKLIKKVRYRIKIKLNTTTTSSQYVNIYKTLIGFGNKNKKYKHRTMCYTLLERPLENIPMGHECYDYSINKFIKWNSTVWIDSTGATV